MVGKILICISCFTSGLLIGILIIYFFALKDFFAFMKEERMKFHSEIESNMNEIKGEVDKKSVKIQAKMLEEKGEISDGKEE